MPTAIVLFSGGLDSTTCLALAKVSGYECHTVSFDYGQRHKAEMQAAQALSAHYGAKHHVIRLPTESFSGSALTDNSIDVPDHTGDSSIPVTYVPARNTIFLSFALGLAEVYKASAIFTGVSSIDYSHYPDCRPEFIQAFENMANLATKAAVEGSPVHIKTPLLHLSKAQTIALGTTLGVDYSQTISCYQANSSGEACGRCDSCSLRKQGFAEAKLTDVTRYTTPA